MYENATLIYIQWLYLSKPLTFSNQFSTNMCRYVLDIGPLKESNFNNLFFEFWLSGAGSIPPKCSAVTFQCYAEPSNNHKPCKKVLECSVVTLRDTQTHRGGPETICVVTRPNISSTGFSAKMSHSSPGAVFHIAPNHM